MKRFLAFVTVIVMSLSVTAISYASETNEDKTVVGTTNISDSQTLQPENTAVTYTWKVESKKKIGEETGKWKTVHQKEIKKADAPGTVKYSYTKSYKHSFSGSLEVSYKVLTAALGFDVRSSESETVNFIKKNASTGTWYCKLRPVYYKYKVVQRQYRVGAGSSGTPMDETKTVIVKKFHHCEDTVTKNKN